MSATTGVDAFFDREAAVAEAQAGRIRIVILALVQLRLVLAQGDEMLAGVRKHWLTTSVIVVGVLGTLALGRYLRSRREVPGASLQTVSVMSTLLDAMLAFLIVLPGVLWPREGYVGVLAAPDFGVWPIIATGAGLRLSAAAARLGPLAAMGGVAGLVAIDLRWNAELLRYGAAEIALAGVLMVAATLLARGMERRIRRLVHEGAQRAVAAERTRRRFGAYVPQDLVDALLENPEIAPGEGAEVEVAILFTDLRGFTEYGEGTPAPRLVRELNGYLEAMVAVVHAHHGIVDRFTGDGILAVFGLPTLRGDEASRALAAASELSGALARLNEQRAEQGLPTLSHGVGVHWGAVIAGHVGTANRLQYTVLGDAVNVASRLQEATKELGVEVVVSRRLVNRAEEEGTEAPAMRSLPSLTPRGRRAPVAICTPER